MVEARHADPSSAAEQRSAPLWVRSRLIRPSAPPRRRFRQPRSQDDGIWTVLYLLAEQIDDQRELAWHEARNWNRRGVVLSSLAALGSAFTGAAVATTDTLSDRLRAAVVIVAFLASGLGAAAAAIRAPERAAAAQVKFARLDSLSRQADSLELIELPSLEAYAQRERIESLRAKLDEVNNVPSNNIASNNIASNNAPSKAP
jgi:hypothetical protein